MTIPERTELTGNKEGSNPESFVVDILQYKGSSERMIGYRKLQEAGLITPNPIFVLTHPAYKEYQAIGMTARLQAEILNAFHQIREKNPHRGVFLGWRTVLPGGELPPGPRTAAVYDEEEYLATVEKTWKFAQEQGYDIEGAEITLVLHPFINASQPPMKEVPFLQWPGGDVTPLPDGRISVRTTWGPDEAVQGYPYDEYLVSLRRKETRIEKKVALKTKTLISKTGSQYEEDSILPDLQREQVLKDSQIMGIAESYQGVSQRFGLHRLEWIVQQEGIVFRECAPFDVKPEDFFFLKGELTQPTIVIASESDIARVTPPSAIIHYPAELYQDRRIIPFSILLASQAKRENINLVVLAHGLIATQHMVRRHQDFDQSVLFTGEEELDEGELIRVFRDEDGTPKWERVKKELNNIVDLRDARRMPEAAPKARNLSILAGHGQPVPKAIYLTEKMFEQHLAFLGLLKTIKELDTLGGEALRQRCEEIQKAILESELPTFLVKQIREKLEQFPVGEFSVRSAENHEDEATALAGLFKSYIGVPRDVTPEKILECWASGFSYHTLEYAKASGISPSEIKMAVLIQETIKGKGGVMYTRERVDIFAGKSPEAITSGIEEKPLRIEINRDGEILKEEIHPEGQILARKEIEQLVALGLQIEEIFGGKPQDIEWIIDQEGKLWILQARPLA